VLGRSDAPRIAVRGIVRANVRAQKLGLHLEGRDLRRRRRRGICVYLRIVGIAPSDLDDVAMRKSTLQAKFEIVDCVFHPLIHTIQGKEVIEGHGVHLDAHDLALLLDEAELYVVWNNDAAQMVVGLPLDEIVGLATCTTTNV
jgi:hypothetical protein